MPRHLREERASYDYDQEGRDPPDEPTLLTDNPHLRHDIESRGRWFKTPNSLIDNTELNGYEKLVYLILLRHLYAGETCFPGQDSLAERTGWSIRHVYNTLQGLQEAGWIKIRRRGQGRTNVYTVSRWSD